MRQAVYSRIDYGMQNPPQMQPAFSQTLDLFTQPRPVCYNDRLLNYNRNDDLVVWHLGREHQPPGFGYIDRIDRRGLYYLHFILNGSGEFNGVHLGAGEGFLSWAGVYHTMIADRDDPWEYCWIGFGGASARRHLERAGFSPSILTFRYDNQGEVTALFDEMIYTLHPNIDLDLYLEGCLLSLLARQSAQNAGLSHRAHTGSDYAAQAAAYLGAHYADPDEAKINQMAEELHINRQYLYRRFRAAFGVTPHAYLTSLRIERAKALLRESDESVESIAAAVGYSGYAPFSRRFHAICGESPAQYRQNCRKS